MRRLLRVLLSVAFLATGWVSVPAAARPCCPCVPAPACCPLSAPSGHALPGHAPRTAATKRAEPRCWKVAEEVRDAASNGSDAAPWQGFDGSHAGRPPARAWLRVWRI